MLDRRQFLGSSLALTSLGLGVPWRAMRADTPVAGGPAALNALFGVFMDERFSKAPEQLTVLGLDKDKYAWARRELDDASLARAMAAKAENASRLARLRAFPRASVSGMDLANYDTVEYQMETLRRLAPFEFGDGPRPYVLSQLTGAYQQVPTFLDRQHRIETREDADAYLARLAAFARVLDQEIERVQHDVGLKVVPPDFLLDRAIEQLRTLRATEPRQSILVTSVAQRSAQKGLTGDYGEQATRIVTTQVYPALERQLALLTELRRAAVHDAGISRLPQGAEFYQATLRYATTTEMTADEIHRLGLEQAKELSARMDALLRKQGKSQGTVSERMQSLLKDPQYLYPDTDAGRQQILDYCNGLLTALQPHLPHYFRILPRTPVEIRRVPPYTEAGAPGGYYQIPALDGSRPGAFYINLRDTAELPRWSLPTLVHHEAAPGHHFQLALVLEMPSLPLIRKAAGGFSANTEGWALYAEQLSDEMGLYDDDPLGRLGMLQAALFRAARCVVDTGLHAQGWSRERAIDYMVETSGQPRTEMTTEVERYCTWPGQATSYKVGHTRWLQLREQARQRLKQKFDIRDFHDTGLSAAPMPLTVLDRVIEDWLRSREA
ncbi:MAG: DUF885 family protein [Gammaproteobacteria bacterium]|nr:DUF885 family protein [Gammaproteobacteria bacterium]